VSEIVFTLPSRKKRCQLTASWFSGIFRAGAGNFRGVFGFSMRAPALMIAGNSSRVKENNPNNNTRDACENVFDRFTAIVRRADREIYSHAFELISWKFLKIP
jgi:hypothetical protein